MIKIGDAMVGVNTARPNKIVSEAISNGKIKELRGYATLRNEVKYGKKLSDRHLSGRPGKRRLLRGGQERHHETGYKPR